MVDARTKSVVAPSAATSSAFWRSKGATTRSGAVASHSVYLARASSWSSHVRERDLAHAHTQRVESALADTRRKRSAFTGRVCARLYQGAHRLGPPVSKLGKSFLGVTGCRQVREASCRHQLAQETSVGMSSTCGRARDTVTPPPAAVEVENEVAAVSSSSSPPLPPKKTETSRRSSPAKQRSLGGDPSPKNRDASALVNTRRLGKSEAPRRSGHPLLLISQDSLP